MKNSEKEIMNYVDYQLETEENENREIREMIMGFADALFTRQDRSSNEKRTMIINADDLSTPQKYMLLNDIDFNDLLMYGTIATAAIALRLALRA